ncbi:hypothetical protein [Streptococcus hyointestinalis]|uniref:hypothetical protein n=1 Tax=Streptococcus hyointestinalis TaxID=1337 RepID=UPI003F02C9C3
MIFWTFIILDVIVVTLLFIQNKKNNKVIEEMIINSHQNTLIVLLMKNPNISDKYPNFYRVVSSFDKVNLGNIVTLKRSVKKVDKKSSKKLQAEMISIVENGAEQEKCLLLWYINTCKHLDEVLKQTNKDKIVSDMRIKYHKHYSEEITYATTNISKGDVSSSKDFCFV